jgi:pheromone shutdown protein TraB
MWRVFPDSSMPVPQHVQKKLQQMLGAEAGEDLVAWMEEVDTARGDIAELRHEMQIGFARIDARFSAMEALLERRIREVMMWCVTLSGVSIGIATLALLLTLLRG